MSFWGQVVFIYQCFTAHNIFTSNYNNSFSFGIMSQFHDRTLVFSFVLLVS
eukprot:UN15220